MSEGERSKILEIAALRQVMPGTPGYVLLEKLLHTRPSEHAFGMLARHPSHVRCVAGGETPDPRGQPACVRRGGCEYLGGLLGFRSISTDERTALQRVAREIAEAHTEGARTITAGASVVRRASTRYTVMGMGRCLAN